MANVRNADLIEKMTSSDKDFRFMAINDIMESLKNKSITLDDSTENQLITNLLKLLEDSNAEVQNLDVKCIALFVNYLSQNRLFITFDALCKKINEGEEPTLRDTAAIALRSAIIDFNSFKNVSFNALVDKVMPQLIAILAKNNDSAVHETILDIVAHMFRRTGNKLDFKYDGLSDVLFKHAESERYGVRRRAQQALALHAEVADNKLFDTIVKRVYASCQKYMSNSALMKTYIATTTAICKNSGQRFSDSLPAFTELFLQICHRSEDDELREVTIGAFETFFHRCPDAVAPFDDQISKVVIALLEYDPNYSYDDSDNEDSMEIDQQSEDGDDDDDDSDYSDDDDVSWKVRRASAKCIAAIITHGKSSLYQNYATYGKLLIKRMKEREDNVKQDILNAYLALIRETRLLVPDNIVPLNLRTDASCMYEKISMEDFTQYVADDEERKKIYAALNEQIPALIRRISSAQKTKNTKVLEHSFILLSVLVTAYPGSIGFALPQLARGIKQSLADRDGNMKLHTLRFLAYFFATHDYKDYKDGVAEILPDILKLAGDAFAKVSFEAIEAVNSLICSMANSSAPKDSKVLTDIYNLLIIKFQVTDMDQEVKDKTTYGLGFFVASFGDSLGGELDKCLSLLVDRLSNEISRSSALRALTVIARSDKNFLMKSVVPTISRYFGEFLRKTHRTLRIYTLSLAIAIAERNEPGNLEGVDLTSTYVELPQLLVDTDLQIAQLSLRLAALLLKLHPKSVGNVQPVLDAAMKLTQSPLLQGITQKTLLEFLDVYTHAKIGNKVDFKQLVDEYMGFVTGWPNYSKSAYLTVAKSIATLARGSPISSVLPLTKELEKFVMKGATVNIKILSVLIIGELGRVYPAVYTDKASIKPEEVATSCFTPTCEEELKMSASQALGSLAVGNIQRFLPFILEQIKEQASRQYLLVYALRELITSDSVDSAGQQLFASNMDTIWNGILSQASSNESTRQVVSECLGKLCLMNPQKYLQELVTCFRNENHLVRSTALTAIRYMISDKSIPADAFLMKVLPKFFEGVQDENIDTRRFAFVLVATVANHKPSLIRDNLDKVLPHIYVETTPRPELRYEVEMGPFKNLVDDGLELRRSAFECMYNLVEHCLDRVSFHEFLQNLEKGLNDCHDVKQLAYLTLIRLTETCPHQISQYADGLADIMKGHLQAKPKQNAVKIDNDKQDEMKRTVIRALVGIKKMQTHERLPKIDELFEWVTKDFAGMLSEVKSDPTANTASPSASNNA